MTASILGIVIFMGAVMWLDIIAPDVPEYALSSTRTPIPTEPFIASDQSMTAIPTVSVDLQGTFLQRIEQAIPTLSQATDVPPILPDDDAVIGDANVALVNHSAITDYLIRGFLCPRDEDWCNQDDIRDLTLMMPIKPLDVIRIQCKVPAYLVQTPQWFVAEYDMFQTNAIGNQRYEGEQVELRGYIFVVDALIYTPNIYEQAIATCDISSLPNLNFVVDLEMALDAFYDTINAD